MLLSNALTFLSAASLATAHTVIVYPGWRGNNIHTNGTVSLEDASIKPGSLGINYENGTYGFPFGMQWMYPCEFLFPFRFDFFLGSPSPIKRNKRGNIPSSTSRNI